MKNNYKHGLLLRLCMLFLVLGGISLAQAQNTIELTGIVTDSLQTPIPGVNVQLKHRTSGTTTNFEGEFRLTASPQDTLVISYLGFQTQQVSIENQTFFEIALNPKANALQEVVINAGYYTTTERERTGSISKVTVEEIENQPVSNVLSAVQGRMAGVNITQSSGVPGSGYDIKIRGTNSLRRNGNYPLYIIDGVPVNAATPSFSSAGILPANEINPLSTINPNDIESIEILKDADATAIYGSRGANGVILVTTKKGKVGETSFSVNTSTGISQVASHLELMNTQQYLKMRREAFANDGITEYPETAYDINGTWDQKRSTDWQDKLIGGTARSSSVQVAIQGGNETTNFRISGSHNEQTTVFSKGFRYKTNNLSGSLSHHSQDKRFQLNASGLFSDQSNNLIAGDITQQALSLSPNAPALYEEDGSLNWEDNTYNNPVASYKKTYSNKNRAFNTNLNLNYAVWPALHVKFNGGISHQVFEEATLTPNTIYNPAYGITSANSSDAKSSRTRFSYVLEPQLNYKQSFNHHQLEVLIGGTFQKKQSSDRSVFSYGFESNALITNIAAASGVIVNNDDLTDYKYAAVFGRINYKYRHKYLLNLTGRRDGSSRFGPDKRFANFGAIGAAWIFSKENFLKDLSWLSFGKLRGSYGVTGSDLIGDYQYLDTYSVNGTVYGSSTTLSPSRLYNPNFSWEQTKKLEIALELGFLKDRVKLNTAWYRNRSGNQLVGIPLPGTTGFSSIQANLPATVENKGLEIELNTIPLKTRNFQWKSNLNLSFPKNKLISFPGLEGSTYANQYVIGEPTSIAKVYNYEGINSDTGMYNFKDYNADGAISSPDDKQAIERIGVNYFGGWENRLSYKNLNLSFLFQFVKQRQKNYNSVTLLPGSMINQPIEVLNVWSEENPNGKYMPYSSGADAEKNQSHFNYMNSTAAVSDASYIRLKNIQLNYRLSINKYISDINIYVQGQNLLTFTNYFGVDPEFTFIGFLPPLKTYSFGVQLNF